VEGCSSITADSVRTHERDMAAAGVVAVNPRAATEAAASIVMLNTTTIEIGEVTQMWNRQFMVWGKVSYQLPSYVLQAASWSTSLFSSLSYAPSPSRLPGAAAT